MSETSAVCSVCLGCRARCAPWIGRSRHDQHKPALHGRQHTVLLADHRQFHRSVRILPLDAIRSQSHLRQGYAVFQVRRIRLDDGEARAAGAGV